MKLTLYMEWNMNITHGLISFFGNNRDVAAVKRRRLLVCLTE